VTFAKRQNKSFNPIHINFLGEDAVMLETDFAAHWVKQCWAMGKDDVSMIDF
jgi:hypothetical protein